MHAGGGGQAGSASLQVALVPQDGGAARVHGGSGGEFWCLVEGALAAGLVLGIGVPLGVRTCVWEDPFT